MGNKSSQNMSMARRQQKIYDYLPENLDNFDHPPTLDELLASRGALHKRIRVLTQADPLKSYG